MNGQYTLPPADADTQALNTTKIGAGTIAAYGTQGAVASNLTDAVNELAALTTMAGQQGYMRPSPNATTFSQAGIGSSATLGTATARAIADTTYLTRRKRYGADSAGTAGSAAGIQFFIAGPTGWFSRNSGFQTTQVMAISQLSANVRWFCGLTLTNGSTGDPQAMTNMVGMGCNAAGNVQVWSNDASGTASLVKDLGASFPARNANAVYLLWLFCAPGGTTIYWRVQRLDVPAVDSGTITSDLMVASVLPFPAMWANNNADASVVKVDILGYEEAVPFG
jgi:hypothetical protein